MDSEETKETTP
jgi:coiled-coil domain-containing protein 6